MTPDTNVPLTQGVLNDSRAVQSPRRVSLCRPFSPAKDDAPDGFLRRGRCGLSTASWEETYRSVSFCS